MNFLFLRLWLANIPCHDRYNVNTLPTISWSVLLSTSLFEDQTQRLELDMIQWLFLISS